MTKLPTPRRTSTRAWGLNGSIDDVLFERQDLSHGPQFEHPRTQSGGSSIAISY